MCCFIVSFNLNLIFISFNLVYGALRSLSFSHFHFRSLSSQGSVCVCLLFLPTQSFCLILIHFGGIFSKEDSFSKMILEWNKTFLMFSFVEMQFAFGITLLCFFKVFFFSSHTHTGPTTMDRVRFQSLFYFHSCC